MAIAHITNADSIPLAYEQHNAQSGRPHLVFLGGYRSDMAGTKASHLAEWTQSKGLGYTRFDYRGHGQSGGDFLQATVGDWKADALTIIDQIGNDSLILIGSSMGAHLMFLTALARPERVKGLLGIASAPDFTEELMWEQATDEHKVELESAGVIYLPSDYSDEPYPITMKLIEEGRNHLILADEIALDCPATLLHGVLDEDVPWEYSVLLAAQLHSMQVDVQLVKDGDHRFSRPQDLMRITQALENLADQITQS